VAGGSVRARNASDVDHVVCCKIFRRLPRIAGPGGLSSLEDTQIVIWMKKSKNLMDAALPPTLPELEDDGWAGASYERSGTLNNGPFGTLNVDLDERRVDPGRFRNLVECNAGDGHLDELRFQFMHRACHTPEIGTVVDVEGCYTDAIENGGLVYGDSNVA